MLFALSLSLLLRLFSKRQMNASTRRGGVVVVVVVVAAAFFLGERKKERKEGRKTFVEEETKKRCVPEEREIKKCRFFREIIKMSLFFAPQ